VRLAQSLGLALYYVPSMRNGAPTETDEDRGNAILSTEPLSSFTAIELPFERQRRVAVAAAVSGSDGAGAGWTLKLASVHLESSASARRLWILASGVRTKQADAVLDVLEPDQPLVLGGDFNTWFGFSDPTYRTIAGIVPDAARADRRSTFPPFFRLDHLFSRAPDGWTASAARVDGRFGSDHYPILGRFQRSTRHD
jgi:endonuclease/exonuclease/phosphatase family metal-dependent hydrolase